MRFVIIGLLVLSALLPLAAAGAGIFDNAGFEEGFVPDQPNMRVAVGWQEQNVDPVGGWRGSGGNPGAMYILHHFDTCTYTAGIWQDLTGLTPGHSYFVSVDVGTEPNGDGPSVGRFSIDVNGAPNSQFDVGPGYTTVSTSFIAPPDQLPSVGFREISCPIVPIHVDNAAITDITPPVPLPELPTLALTAVGLVVVLGLVLGRRH